MSDVELEGSQKQPSHNDLQWLNQSKRVYTPITGTWTLDDRTDIVIATATLTLTLPKATRGRELHVVKAFAGSAVTVTPYGTDTINGAASLSITATWDAKWLKAISGGWVIL